MREEGGLTDLPQCVRERERVEEDSVVRKIPQTSKTDTGVSLPFCPSFVTLFCSAVYVCVCVCIVHVNTHVDCRLHCRLCRK